jgi:hypothetical protein
MSNTRVPVGVPQPQGVGEDPLLHYTKLFVRFLQVVFNTFEKGAYRWEPDLELTDLIISDQGVLGRDVVEKRPAIVCMRGPARWSNVAMDQFKSFEFETGKSDHTDLIASSMTYNCLAKEGLEAQRIAWIASYATRTLKKSLLKAGLHRVGENIDIGQETDAENLIPDAGKLIRLVPVSVPFFFQDSYSIAPVDNLLLKALDLRLTSEATAPAAAQAALRGPSMGGRVLKYDKVFSLTQRVMGKIPLAQKNRK